MLIFATARKAIADVVDFWNEGRGELSDEKHCLGEHNADRVLMALDDAGLKIVPKNEA